MGERVCLGEYLQRDGTMVGKAWYQEYEASLLHASAVKKRANRKQEPQRCTPQVCFAFPHSTTTSWDQVFKLMSLGRSFNL